VFPSTGFISHINTIGYDWKTNDPVTHLYTIDDTRVFFVKDRNGAVYRIKFNSFEGSATGNISFDISIVE